MNLSLHSEKFPVIYLDIDFKNSPGNCFQYLETLTDIQNVSKLIDMGVGGRRYIRLIF